METSPLMNPDFWATHQLEARHTLVDPYIQKNSKYKAWINGDFIVVKDDKYQLSFHHVNTFSATRNKYFNIIEK